ncbi:MAG TPA: DUF1080 domain-containing protein [Chitinophagaceae bacterium]|nr:DUF1080 domain-containing protein [Chitinophagaceae bacterium]
MSKIFTLLVAAFIFCGCSSTKVNTMNTSPNTLSAKEKKDGWQSLFDGQTTNGWHAYGKQTIGKAWKVEDGALHLDAAFKKTAPNEGGDIVTDQEFDNFDLKLEWKISPKGNSGIMIYVKEDAAKYGQPYFTGPEMQIVDNAGHPDGKLFKHKAADLYDLIPSTREAAKPVGEWNQVEIIANNGKLDFYFNGEHNVSTNMWDDNWRSMIAGSKFKAWPDFGTFKSGRIDLQDHGDEVWFRNIKIKRL